MYFTNLNLPVEGGVIKPGLDVVVGCTYFMALITLSLFFRRRVGGGWGGGVRSYLVTYDHKKDFVWLYKSALKRIFCVVCCKV